MDKKVIFILTDLYNPILEQIEMKNSNLEFINLSKVDLEVIQGIQNAKLMMPDGSLNKVSDVNKIYSNKEVILDLGLKNLKEKYKVDEYIKTDNEHISELSQFMKEQLEAVNSYANTATDNDDHYLLLMQAAMRVTSCYIILGNKVEELDKDENANEALREAIRSIREEEEMEVTNELDLVNKLLKDTLGDNLDIQIESATYNNEAIDIEDITYKLSTHVLPEFITQIDIRDTLDDEYTIETNKCTIKRHKGGKIEILDK